MYKRQGYIRAISNLRRNEDSTFSESYNYAVGSQGSREPGSTFKLASMIALLEDSKLKLHDSIDTGNGSFKFFNETMRDHKKGGFGTLSIQEAFEKSSNIGIAKLIQNHFGRLVEDVRPLVRLSVSVIVESKGKREQGSSGGGGRYNLNYFDDEILSKYTKEAVDNALINLEAEASPAGSMTVVLGSGWPGILLHEAIGHGLEGDFNRKGTSAFSDKMGQQVASKGIHIVDDGTIDGRRGSLNVDDEGNVTKNTTLIEDGKLVGYIQDAQNANLMNMDVTGNGRRESYAHLPMPRMTNTYMLNGNHTKEEIIKSVKNGLYANNFGGGQVDITSGKFVFSASEAYLIKDGRISHPVKGATIIGNGPDILKQVSMVGNDLSLDSGVGTCGKDGQSVPVGVGQPTLKIDNIVVGGTN